MTAVAVDSAPPPVQRAEERRGELRAMKRRATGLLIVVSVAWLALLVFVPGNGAGGFARAAAEASMVGGLADWFAVTALFRHPLGIPIPHTAVIRARKDQFGETLGAFVQENFLSPEVLGARVRGANVGHRLGDWLADPANAAIVAGHAADLGVKLLDVVHDDDVHGVLEEQLRLAVDKTPLAPMAGRMLRTFVDDGRHQDVLDAMLQVAEHALDDNQEALRARFSAESPWWLPDAVEDRIFERLLDGARLYLKAINEDPRHEVRMQFDARAHVLVDELESSPEMRARGEQLKHDLLNQPALRRLAASMWTQAQTSIREQAADPDSPLRTRIARTLAATGTRLRDEPALASAVDDAVESGARYVAEHFHTEIAALISGTIARWDGEQTSDRLELLLGRDLQWIRINGTVVGALAGVALHAVAIGLG